ncbi:methionyl-tRNA formyltransferase [Microbacterium awajiense]|uniref:Methionyl-tRNA formyltransferase n=1 Tax=Microbacterium awajiense TaxID=415214 RepID=A0ABP7A4H2_9MICO
MRLVFAGTPEPAVPSLRRLLASDHDVVAVITRRDAPLGRKRVLTPSPVAATAADAGTETIRVNRLDGDTTARVAALDADLGVIVAYGGLVREPLLATPRHGWINLHFSLLPRWRGAAPVQHALINGDTETGVSVFRLVAELDAGDVFARRAVSVPRGATAGALLDELAVLGADVLLEVVDAIAAGTATTTPQTGEATFAPKLTAEDGRIRWNEPGTAVLNRINGATPEPGAFTTIDGARLKVLSAAASDRPSPGSGRIAGDGRAVLAGASDGAVELLRVQPAGKPPMDAADWWRGQRAPSVAVGT